MILQALAQWNLEEIKLEVVGSVLNFCKAAHHRCLHSLLNQGLFTFFAEPRSVLFMICWVVWNACISYIYEFFGEFKNDFGIVYYEVFLTLRAKFFPVSFI